MLKPSMHSTHCERKDLVDCLRVDEMRHQDTGQLRTQKSDVDQISRFRQKTQRSKHES